MKVEKIVFTFTGRIGDPQAGDYFLSVNGESMLKCNECADLKGGRKIYTREVIEEDWKPREGEFYYTPTLNRQGEAGYHVWNHWTENVITDATLIFPTPELARAKMQEWLDAEKQGGRNEQQTA